MRRASALVFALAGLGLGTVLNTLSTPAQTLRAASSDRHQDYVMCTGAVTINPRLQTDGVWLLDYRSGKLLGNCIDKSTGKMLGWAEVYLPTEFGVKPEQDVHFIMTTGYVQQGVAALYVAETTTGKFGVYTMSGADTNQGIQIRRHDLTNFRTMQPAAVQPAAATIPGMPGVPASTVPGQPYPSVPAPTSTPGTSPGMPAVPSVPAPFPTRP